MAVRIQQSWRPELQGAILLSSITSQWWRGSDGGPSSRWHPSSTPVGASSLHFITTAGPQSSVLDMTSPRCGSLWRLWRWSPELPQSISLPSPPPSEVLFLSQIPPMSSLTLLTSPSLSLFFTGRGDGGGNMVVVAVELVAVSLKQWRRGGGRGWWRPGSLPGIPSIPVLEIWWRRWRWMWWRDSQRRQPWMGCWL
jgi:hypothetical protein